MQITKTKRDNVYFFKSHILRGQIEEGIMCKLQVFVEFYYRLTLTTHRIFIIKGKSKYDEILPHLSWSFQNMQLDFELFTIGP